MANPELIKVYHYSSEPKPWARFLEDQFHGLSEQEWLHEVRRHFKGYRAWVLNDVSAIGDEARRGGQLAVGPDGLAHRFASWAKDGEESNAEQGKNREGDQSLAGDTPEACPVATRDAEPMLSEDGWPLVNEPHGVDKASVLAAEQVTGESIRLWDTAYHELSEHLNLTDLGATVKAACERPVIGMNAPNHEDAGEEPARGKADWGPVGGWWIERDPARAVATCTVDPPHAVLSHGHLTLLAADSIGVHLAAIGDECPPPRSFQCDDSGLSLALAWVNEVPDNTTVMLAINCPGSAGDMLPGLSGAGLGCPAAAPPEGYNAMSAVGKKRTGTWHSTHADLNSALASG